MNGSHVSRTQHVHQVQGFEKESQAQETPQGEGHHNGHCYRHGKHTAGRAAPKRSPLKPRRPQLRRSQNMHAGGGDEEQFDHDMSHDNMDEDKYRDPAVAAMEMANSQQQAWQGGQQQFQQRGGDRHGDGPPKKLQFKLASMLGAVDDLPQRLVRQGLPGAQEIFGASGGHAAAELVGALGSLVLALARQAASAKGRPSLTRAVLAADHAHACRQQYLQLSLTLSDVKRLLVAQRRQVWGDQPLPAGAPESVGDTLALLPLQLLNAARPRTPMQRRQAIDRKQLILKTRGL